LEAAAYPERVIMRARRVDHANLKTIAGQLRAAGRRPTVTAIMRHALEVAATVERDTTAASETVRA